MSTIKYVFWVFAVCIATYVVSGTRVATGIAPGTDWTRHATVVLRAHLPRSNSAPKWIFNDTNRQQMLDDLRPDVLDFLDVLQVT